MDKEGLVNLQSHGRARVVVAQLGRSLLERAICNLPGGDTCEYIMELGAGLA